MPARKPDAAVSADLAAARRVLTLEASGLEALAKGLGPSFSEAVGLLDAARGRVIVSGMGKSGHVGVKIAATFASTGRPAQFVHPAEASHGDLGMIAAGDAALLLSNSGETRELSDLVGYTRRNRIPLIGVASRADSTLLRAADVALLLPKVPEACPNALAPTTSTTMMLALGDALAVALMERRGFGPDDYARYHPGGSLGQALMKVGEIMLTGDRVAALPVSAPLAAAIAEIGEKRLGCVLALDRRGRVAGILTDGDLRRRWGQDLSGLTLGDVMTAKPASIGARDLVAKALALMNERRITVLAVTGAGGPALIHMHDCLRAGFR
jgi:arabinose-5-phosphate isomerase